MTEPFDPQTYIEAFAKHAYDRAKGVATQAPQIQDSQDPQQVALQKAVQGVIQGTYTQTPEMLGITPQQFTDWNIFDAVNRVVSSQIRGHEDGRKAALQDVIGRR